MLPPFDSNGLLPPTPHGEPYVCTVDEVRRHFVDDLGAPAWRVALFEGWDLVRRGVGLLVPSSRWWLWGCFVSSHPEPVFGQFETVQALVICPAVDLPQSDHEVAMLLNFIASAQEHHHVDLTAVYEFPLDHPAQLDAVDALEFKWRPRATRNIGDHVTKMLVPAGFVEVQP